MCNKYCLQSIIASTAYNEEFNVSNIKYGEILR
jgi:hypothetical protein